MTSLPDGVYAAATTPRRLGMQDINLGVIWELIDFLQERKVSGIVLMGATGEFVHFSNAERMRLMGLAPRRSRIPVLFNVSHSTLDGAVELAQASAASGAAGVLLMPPYFFRYSGDEIRTFYRRFAQEAAIDIPTLIYNIPQFGNDVTADVALELIREGVVQGLKDSSGSREYLAELTGAWRQDRFLLFAGNDALLTEAHAGGISGVVSGVGCAIPELVTALYRALEAGNIDVSRRLEARLSEFIEWIDRFPVPVGIREATCLRGIPLGPNAAPSSPTTRNLLQDFRDWFRPWLKEVIAETRLA